MWVWITLLCAFMLAARDSAIKWLSRDHDIFLLVAVNAFITAVVALGFQLGRGAVDWRVFCCREALPWFAALVPLDALAIFLYYTAISKSPLSLTAPFQAFTPAFIPFVSWLLIGERISERAVPGIAMVVLGGYGLFFQSVRDWWEPFRQFKKEKGSTLMLVVAVIYSVTSVLGRKLVQVVGADNMGAFYPLTNAALVLFLFFVTHRLRGVAVRIRHPWVWLAAGVSGAIMITAHFMAISMTKAAYMISVKRTSGLFSMLFAALVFGERDILRRTLAAAVMVAGVLWIAFV
jgi:drug/metabolite transporter (DMT)-like permease